MLRLFAPSGSSPHGAGGCTHWLCRSSHQEFTLYTSACYWRSTNLPFCFQINRTLKNQRRVRSQTRQCPILLNFCFLYLCFYQESNCTCDWCYPEVEALPQGLHQSMDFSPNVQDLIHLNLSLWRFTLVPFTLNQCTVLTILSTGHPIKYESFCSWKVVYFLSLHNKSL